jgi:plasmid stabilization system protein ParE
VKLLFKRRALRHLKQIHAYIAKDNPVAAARVVGRILKVTSRLSLMPMSGRPGVVKGAREVVIPDVSYIAVYRIRAGNVEILAVLHSARQRRR